MVNEHASQSRVLRYVHEVGQFKVLRLEIGLSGEAGFFKGLLPVFFHFKFLYTLLLKLFLKLFHGSFVDFKFF